MTQLQRDYVRRLYKIGKKIYIVASLLFVNVDLDPMSFTTEDMTNKLAFFVSTILQY